MSPARILDPRAVPVVGRDLSSAPVPLAELTAAALRARFARHVDWLPESRGDDRASGSDRAPAAAAVLVPLVPGPAQAGGMQVLLTHRTAHLRAHAGQISFPGGRSEPTDSGPAATALREAFEEVGLHPDRVEVIGLLPTYITVTNFVVTPVVALLETPFELGALHLDVGEVADAFLVPLAFLMDPSNHQRHRYAFEGGSRHFWSMPWRVTDAKGAEREHYIWGATAAMLRNLYRFLSAP